MTQPKAKEIKVQEWIILFNGKIKHTQKLVDINEVRKERN
tara:strand:+ start:915 stop:1034 length:120 start_codon:yes stop_codon:yes gene_type:complete